jgi:hypothetical protein
MSENIMPELDNAEIKRLAYRLQNSAYSHGVTDSKEYSTDKKYREAADKSNEALNALLDYCDRILLGHLS